MVPAHFNTFNSWLEKLKCAPAISFLLPDLIHWIKDYNLSAEVKINWQDFEFWLNHFSRLSYEEERQIRGKITGKYLPREDFQIFFPVGMGQKYNGSHFIAAHLSPDLDTTVASFLYWMEAVSCKVGSKQHIWNLPGEPEPSTLKIFSNPFGPEVFKIAARTETQLSLTAKDLLTQEGFLAFQSDTPVTELEHTYYHQAMVLVDEKGRFVGDWRLQDIETTGQITLLFKTLLKSFEIDFIIYYLKELGKKGKIRMSPWKKSFDLSGFNEKQKNQLTLFLQKIVNLEKSAESNFEELFKALNLEIPLFNFEEEPFSALEQTIRGLNNELTKALLWTDKLGTAIRVKEKINLKVPHFIHLNTGLEEIRFQMKDYDSLTVEDSTEAPIGIVRAKDLRVPSLGVVSFCDFSNFDEVKMPNYLTLISVVDHHKSAFNTLTPASVSIGDVQSCNILMAESLFNQLERAKTNSSSSYFIHPEREKVDFRLTLLAILDDTDFLTKVSRRDILCIAKILARLKTLESHQEVLPSYFEELPANDNFAKLAAEKLLSDPLMIQISKEVLGLKEAELDGNLKNFLAKKTHHLFMDTKEQNGCCLITQIKRFEKNRTSFKAAQDKLSASWIEFAKEIHEKKPEIDLCILMLSSVSFLEGEKDFILFWIPPTDKAKSHLSLFMHAFASQLEEMPHVLQVFNDSKGYLKDVFEKAGEGEAINIEAGGKAASKEPYALLSYPAGKLNSRKSKISPYLP